MIRASAPGSTWVAVGPATADEPADERVEIEAEERKRCTAGGDAIVHLHATANRLVFSDERELGSP